MWRNRTTPEQREEVIRLYMSGVGMTQREIAAKVGISEAVISYIAKKAGLPKRPYGGRERRPLVPAPAAPTIPLIEIELAKLQERANAERALGNHERAAKIETDIVKIRDLEEECRKEGWVLVPHSALNQQDTRV